LRTNVVGQISESHGNLRFTIYDLRRAAANYRFAPQIVFVQCFAMPKPDPEQFARALLWHLAGLRADVLQIQAEIAELRGDQPRAPKGFYEKKARETTTKLYSEAIHACGLEEQPPPSERS